MPAPGHPAYRSPWAKYVGGAVLPTQPAPHRPAYRDFLWYVGGGGCKPPQRAIFAAPRSLLAFWIGGANWHYMPTPPAPPVPPYIPGDLTGGLPYGPRERKPQERYPIDDDDILEFLRLWVTWNDVE